MHTPTHTTALVVTYLNLQTNMHSQTLEKMTNAYVDKHMRAGAGSSPAQNGDSLTHSKVLSPDDEEALVSR
jgi:hypothetical protein